MCLLVGNLLVGGVPHETDGDVAVGQLAVEALDDLDATGGLLLVTGVQEDLHALATVGVHLPAAGNDGAGAQEVLEDGLVDGGAGAGALDLLELVHVVGALGDLALGDQNNNATGEALLELGGEGLLDTADQHDVAEGVEDDESLLLGGLDLLGSVDVEAGQVDLEGLVLQLQIVQGLGDVSLELSGVLALKLAQLTEVGQVGHAGLLVQ
eukprot:408697_1